MVIVADMARTPFSRWAADEPSNSIGHEWHSVKLKTLGFKVLRRKTPAHRLVINNMISISPDPKPRVSETYVIFNIFTSVDLCSRRVTRNSLSHKTLLLIRVPFVPDTNGTRKSLKLPAASVCAPACAVP